MFKKKDLFLGGYSEIRKHPLRPQLFNVAPLASEESSRLPKSPSNGNFQNNSFSDRSQSLTTAESNGLNGNGTSYKTNGFGALKKQGSEILNKDLDSQAVSTKDHFSDVATQTSLDKDEKKLKKSGNCRLL